MAPRRILAIVFLLLFAAAAAAQTVYITKTGAKYHAAGCRYLSKSALAVDLSDAIARGYGPCSVCNPPSRVETAPAPVRALEAAPAPTPVDAAPTQVVLRELSGKVVGVTDGDTLTLLVNLVQHKIRLNGIDAPEIGQAFGQRAKQALADLCFGKSVRVVVVDVDRYGREVGDVFAGDVNINAELVRAGMAWHYKQYSSDETLAKLEVEARNLRRGLWVDSSPIAPWSYRHE